MSVPSPLPPLPTTHAPLPSQVLSIYDLDEGAALNAAKRMRKDAGRPACPPDELKEAVSAAGGRLSYVSRVAKARDALEHARHLLAVEKAWLLSQIGLIPDCDDDVMDEVCAPLAPLPPRADGRGWIA